MLDQRNLPFFCEKFAYFRIDLVLGKAYYWIIMKCILDLVKLIAVRNFSSFCLLADTIVGNGTYTRAG